ncbi:MAG: hypothetical protein K2X57_01235 [Xanthobacteraceae bacterium]|nr:hypothetical protein [Xanthobacteraceae bacterium]
MQAAINTQLSQPIDPATFDGQHGISLAISSIVIDITSATADIETSEAVPAMTGRESGANASPAITMIANSWRMAALQFTGPASHKTAR